MHPNDSLDPNQAGNSRRQIIEQCDASLRRLKTDWIDLYQIHRPEPACPIDETLRALDDLVRSGKVRYIGASTFAAWQLVESLWVSKEYGLNRFVTEQPPYNLLDRRIERELIPAALSYGFAIIPWSPLAGGFLSGKYQRSGKQPEGRFADGMHVRAQALLGNPRAFDAVEALEGLAREKGIPVSQLALTWVAQQPGVTSPIIGPRTLAQLEDNLKAREVEITARDRERIDAISLPGGFSVPFYEAAFGPNARW
jgi:aryl-alcohol dehydrogenase-like predicted oxidoreductase